MFLAITSVGWGFNWPVTKYLLGELPPLTLRGSTGVVGAALLAALALVRGQSLMVGREMWLRLALAALLNVTGWMVLMGLALLWLPASETALIAYTMPVWASILAWPVLGERPTLLRTIALVMAFAGLGTHHGRQRLFGQCRKAAGDIDGAGGLVRVCARHGAGKETAAEAAADPGRQLADRARLLPGGAGGACDRDHASRSRDRARLVASGLFDRDPVLHRLCQLVCGAVAPACIRRGDRHHGGARDRRGGLGDRAPRAARAGPDRGAGLHAVGRRAGNAVVDRRVG